MAKKELQLNIFEKKSSSKLNVLLYVAAILALVFVLFFNFVSMCGISGVSMQNTLDDGQNVLLLNVKDAGRGDIIVFQYGDKALIKRVIALENDKLAFVADKDGNVGVYLFNSNMFKKINEGYIYSNPQPMQESWFRRCDKFGEEYNLAHAEELSDVLNTEDIADEFVIEVPKGHYFVMGDNRQDSKDSRSIGTVEEASVYGKLLCELNKGSFIEKVLLFIYGAGISTEQQA